MRAWMSEDAWRKSAASLAQAGGHGERSVAVGATDMAVWDAVAKIEGKPLYRVLAQWLSVAPRSVRARA